MLKKAGFVVAAAAVLAMGAGTAASATTMTQTPTDSSSSSVSFGQAYHQFIKGGAALGYGAASLVAGAYTGVMETPQNVLDNGLLGE